MTESLPVHVSREKLHSLEVPPSFETEGTFDIRLLNHGEAAHVHLHLDDPLSEVAELTAGNHYVEGETKRHVRVDVDLDRVDDDHRGKLKVVSAHGAQTRWIDIEITKPDPDADTVQVDESLAKPQPRQEPEPGLFDQPAIPIVVLGAVAVVIAGTAAMLVRDVAVTVGALVVVAGVAGALVFLFQENETAGR